ncbi:MAG: uncharacterized protein KVP18_005075 [Porospora cf. gigantea A]|uniref:uncharacterized protein n=1 Tax=Porospora cf. gigantea A TaxID=2853593 RepID=UPI00355A8C4B|nr:MAG: hypothetical protein KVP18_005075 [Porospora cf. gigantea A]
MVNPHHLSFYYDRLFPFEVMANWLSYGKESRLPRREFSLSLDGDIYVRWQCFKDSDAWRQKLVRCSPVAEKMDIGASYAISVAHKNDSPQLFIPLERELVFDIDMDDYNDVRTCCQEKTVCAKCWVFLKVAMDILDTSLREDFGFKHILWVYSGRRGIHAWVCDQAARVLKKDQRTAIVEYMSLFGRKTRLRLPQRKWHPFLRRAVTIAEKYWDELRESQQFFAFEHEIYQKKVLDVYGGRIGERLKSLAAAWDRSSEGFWRQFEQAARSANQPQVIKEVILALSYPRLDALVSKEMNHLLKAPFCVHPRTEKICVPISLDFDPDLVPTLPRIRNEMTHSGNVELTSLWPYLQRFQKFVDAVLVSEEKENTREISVKKELIQVTDDW